MSQMCLCMCAGYAQPGVTEDDILLELVMFMGVVCDEVTAPQLVQTGLVGPLSALQPIAVVCIDWTLPCQVRIEHADTIAKTGRNSSSVEIRAYARTMMGHCGNIKHANSGRTTLTLLSMLCDISHSQLSTYTGSEMQHGFCGMWFDHDKHTTLCLLHRTLLIMYMSPHHILGSQGPVHCSAYSS